MRESDWENKVKFEFTIFVEPLSDKDYAIPY